MNKLHMGWFLQAIYNLESIFIDKPQLVSKKFVAAGLIISEESLDSSLPTMILRPQTLK